MLRRTWKESNIVEITKLRDIRQVYVWIFDQLNNVIIVSKDGLIWHLPGGKPNKNEDVFYTAKRELLEETSINLSNIEIKSINFFGYYDYISLDENNNVVDVFQQIRGFIRVDSSKFDNLKPNEPDVFDSIKFIKKVAFDELGKHIEWMPTAGEYLWLDQNFVNIKKDVFK